MKDKANTPQSFIKMEEARRMMDQGQCQESLVLALDALLQELDNLRSSLLALQNGDPVGIAGRKRPGLGRAAPPRTLLAARSQTAGLALRQRFFVPCRLTFVQLCPQVLRKKCGGARQGG